MSDFEAKVRRVCGSSVVDKALARSEVFEGIPRYVVENMIAKHCDPANPKPGLKSIRAAILRRYPRPNSRQALLHELQQRGSLVLMDEVRVEVDLARGMQWAALPALDEDRARIDPGLVAKHKDLLLGGLWASVTLAHEPDFMLRRKVYPVRVAALEPFQHGRPDLESFQAMRREFSTAEWIDLLLASFGFGGTGLPERVKRLLLARAAPLVEPNLNLIELGPRATGKSFFLRNASPYAFLLSSGTTPANLFENLATGSAGIVGTRSVVVFDEIARARFGAPEAVVTILKDYMESGAFARGTRHHTSGASLVFNGNIDVEDGRPARRHRFLLEVLPRELQDSAFADRLHAFLPGWEIPKIVREAIQPGLGFVTDFLAEELQLLRAQPWRARAMEGVRLSPNFTQRDQAAVERASAALLKLLHPHGQWSEEERNECVRLAVEMRQRVHNALVAMAPGEFKPKELSFDGMEPLDAPDLVLPRLESLDRRANERPLVGEVTGLVVVEPGGRGDIFIEEASAIPGEGRLIVTGLHGPVFRHSVEAAMDHLRGYAAQYGMTLEFISSHRIHVHLMRIAEAREGPSAGVTTVLAILSALTKRPVRPGLAVTGEVSLLGKVLGVGGIAEKLGAAKQHGRRLVLVPSENESEATQAARELGIAIRAVSTVAEAVDAALLAASASASLSA